MASKTPDPRVADLVRAGHIRVALFLPQYSKDPATGEFRGHGMGYVAIETARALAARLEIATRFIEHPTPPKALECVKTGACDIAFLGIEPSRAAQIDFSPPVVQFDYTLLVPAGTSIRSFADADQSGVRIAVVRNHASTFALSRLVKHAELVDSDLPGDALELFRAGEAAALAAPREQLVDWSHTLPGSRVLDSGYGINNVGIAIAKGRTGLLAFISDFVEEAKATGLLEGILARGSLHDFQVAPRRRA